MYGAMVLEIGRGRRARQDQAAAKTSKKDRIVVVSSNVFLLGRINVDTTAVLNTDDTSGSSEKLSHYCSPKSDN
jgi:hypothetical protein